MGEGYAAIQREGGCLYWGMTHNAGSVSSQSKAFKYMIASKPQVSWLFLNTYSIGNNKKKFLT